MRVHTFGLGITATKHLAGLKCVHTNQNDERDLGFLKHLQLPDFSDEKAIRKAAKAFNAPTQSGSDDGEITIENMVADENNPSPDQIVLDADDRVRLGELLENIDEREANILKLRYGLNGEDPLTLKEIGSRIGLTRERVRQLEHLSLKKLKEAMER